MSSPSTRSTSILDRPRPKTPTMDSFQHYGAGTGGPSATSSVYSPSPTTTTNTSSPYSIHGQSPQMRHTVFSQSPFYGGSGGPGESTSQHERSQSTSILSRPRTPDSTSVLDRPRPKTPDSFSWMESAGSNGSRGGRMGTMGLPSSGSTTSLSRLTSSSTSQSMATSSSQSSAPLPYRHHQYSSSTTSAPMPRSSSERSFDSFRDQHQYQSQNGGRGLGLAPMLSLDLDLGESAGDGGSMFDLASLLRAGSSSELPATGTTTASVKKEVKVPQRRESTARAAARAAIEGKKLPEVQKEEEEPVVEKAKERKPSNMRLDFSDIPPPPTTTHTNGNRPSPRHETPPIPSSSHSHSQSQTKYSSIPLSPSASPPQSTESHPNTWIPNPPTPTKEKEKESFAIVQPGAGVSGVGGKERRPSHTSSVGDTSIRMKSSISSDSFGPTTTKRSPVLPPAPPKSPSPSPVPPKPNTSPAPIPIQSPVPPKAPSPVNAPPSTTKIPSPKPPPIKRPSISLDKSLPPTPQSLISVSAPQPLPSALPDDSPTKGNTAFKRGMGMMRLGGKSGFQLVSATSTKKTYKQGEAPPPATTTNGGVTSKNLLGRRFFASGRLAGSNPSTSSLAGDNNGLSSIRTRDTDGLSTNGLDMDDDASPDGDKCFPRPPRRSSLSGLMGESSKRSASSLGMRLGAARRSEDLLTRTTASEGGHGELPAGRKSFDLMISNQNQAPPKKKEVPRRPSTDDLLNLATAELSKISVAQPGPSSSNSHNPIPSISTATLESASSPSPLASSPVSPISAEHASPEKASVSVATRVTRSDSTDAPESPNLSRPIVPSKLVRTDSLRSREKGTGVVPPLVAQQQPQQQQAPPASWRKRVKAPDSGVGSDSSMSSAWLDVEDALAAYITAVGEDRPDRGNIVSNILLPFLRREEDVMGPRSEETLAKRQRQILFRWLGTLTTELKQMQPTHRGACLEAVASIAECRFLTVPALENDPLGQARYRSTVVDILQFAIEKLNDKAVYANTLVFSGRILALAFFRIEGIALKLLRSLPPVKRPLLRRIMDEAGVTPENLPAVDLEAFPAHLWNLCLRDFKMYTDLLLSPAPKTPVEDAQYLVRDGAVAVEMSGNWLIRWTASDSDLPFAFYRAYHRQLAAHLVPPELRYTLTEDPPLPPSLVITSPGFLFLAASLLEKCDGLIRVNLRSVTSIGPNNGANFNTNDSANLSFGQKPKVLELANRRLVSTMLDIVGGPPLAPGDASEAPPDADIRRHSFSKVLQVWIRACVKRTSMWSTRSVFILLDLIEGLIYTLSYPAPSSKGSNEDVIVPRPDEVCLEMFDISFIFSFVKIILEKADNTIAIMRTIAFIYAHFEIFTLRPVDRDELCENIILDSELFPRLYLHWNAGVRGYFIRLLVWRLARLGIVAQEQNPTGARDPHILAIFGLMNVRLEAIRKRHDELEPFDNLTDDDLFRPKRSTICSTRGVKEAPYTVDELAIPLDEDSEEEEEPRELVRANVNPTRKGSGIKDVATVARVVTWLKGGLGKSKQNSSNKNGGIGSSTAISSNAGNTNKPRPPPPVSRIDPFVLDYNNITPDSHRDADDFPISDSPPSSSGHDSTWTMASASATSERATPTTSLAPATPERTTPERTRLRRSSPTSPSFFSFEFEGGMPPRSDVDATPASASSSAASISGGSMDTVFPGSPVRRSHLEPQSTVSPRVSLRFSKRISILPPAALDMLKESGEAVPPIPAQYLSGRPTGYDKKLHPYAIRGLRDYEDALDEWTDWVARLQEEEDEGKKHNKGFVDTVPRLSVSWSNAFSDDP